MWEGSPESLFTGPGKVLSRWLRSQGICSWKEGLWSQTKKLGRGDLLMCLCWVTVWQGQGPPAREQHSFPGNFWLPESAEKGIASRKNVGPKYGVVLWFRNRSLSRVNTSAYC